MAVMRKPISMMMKMPMVRAMAMNSEMISRSAILGPKTTLRMSISMTLMGMRRMEATMRSAAKESSSVTMSTLS